MVSRQNFKRISAYGGQDAHALAAQNFSALHKNILSWYETHTLLNSLIPKIVKNTLICYKFSEGSVSYLSALGVLVCLLLIVLYSIVHCSIAGHFVVTGLVSPLFSCPSP